VVCAIQSLNAGKRKERPHRETTHTHTHTHTHDRPKALFYVCFAMRSYDRRPAYDSSSVTTVRWDGRCGLALTHNGTYYCINTIGLPLVEPIFQYCHVFAEVQTAGRCGRRTFAKCEGSLHRIVISANRRGWSIVTRSLAYR